MKEYGEAKQASWFTPKEKADLYFNTRKPTVYEPLPGPAGHSLPLDITSNEPAFKYFSDGEELPSAP
jgi:hypothetical protein